MTDVQLGAPKASRFRLPDAPQGVVLGLLLLIYTCNFIDRSILATLAQAIKLDLQISDAQLGLLQGLAFALFYTALGIPIARLSEYRNRVTIISVSLAVWSGMTALCGLAQNYTQLFLCRIGVGIGEAGCSPPAHSLIADLYPAERRASALAVYSLGIPLGVMVGAMSAGWLAQAFSWRVALVVVGLPGIALAILFRLVVREPARGQSEAVPSAAALDPPPPIGAVVRRLFGNAAFVHITLGATLTGLVGYGTGTFAQAYFIRMFGLSYAEVGFAFGLVSGISAAGGTLLGGFVTDWVGRRRPYLYALIPGLGLLVAGPAYIYAFTRDEWVFALWLMLVPGLFHYAYIGPTLGVMHNLVTPRMRSTATALFFVVVNLIGLGAGPWLTGLAIDAASGRRFAAAGFDAFLATCPGGVAPAGAPAALAQACTSAGAQGTRDGIVVILLVFFWAALHYFIAARLMRGRAGAAHA